MIKFKNGNLITLAKQGQYDIILHGLNCHCKMSDGIALQISKAFPTVEQADLNTKPLDKNKLGTFVPIDIFIENKSFKILNCYTQFDYAGYDLEETDLFDYQAFRKILKDVAKQYIDKKIAMPLIGTGHAGGDISKIINIIKTEFKYNNVDIIVFSSYNQPKELYSFINKIKCFFY